MHQIWFTGADALGEQNDAAVGRRELPQRAFDRLAAAAGGGVVERGVHQIEAPRRLPGEHVADRDAIGPLREPVAKAVDPSANVMCQRSAGV